MAFCCFCFCFNLTIFILAILVETNILLLLKYCFYSYNESLNLTTELIDLIDVFVRFFVLTCSIWWSIFSVGARMGSSIQVSVSGKCMCCLVGVAHELPVK